MTGEAVNAASMAFKKALIERALGAELSHHLGLGYAAGGAKPEPPQRRKRQDRADRRRATAHRGAATATAASSRCSSPSMSGASRASTTRSSPCTLLRCMVHGYDGDRFYHDVFTRAPM